LIDDRCAQGWKWGKSTFSSLPYPFPSLVYVSISVLWSPPQIKLRGLGSAVHFPMGPGRPGQQTVSGAF